MCRSVFRELEIALTGERFLTDRAFRTIRDNSDYFQIYLDANLKLSDGIILESMFPTSSAEEHYARAASEGAFLNVATEWFKAGMQETPEEMSAICAKVIASSVRSNP